MRTSYQIHSHFNKSFATCRVVACIHETCQLVCTYRMQYPQSEILFSSPIILCLKQTMKEPCSVACCCLLLRSSIILSQGICLGKPQLCVIMAVAELDLRERERETAECLENKISWRQKGGMIIRRRISVCMQNILHSRECSAQPHCQLLGKLELLKMMIYPFYFHSLLPNFRHFKIILLLNSVFPLPHPSLPWILLKPMKRESV